MQTPVVSQAKLQVALTLLGVPFLADDEVGLLQQLVVVLATR